MSEWLGNLFSGSGTGFGQFPEAGLGGGDTFFPTNEGINPAWGSENTTFRGATNNPNVDTTSTFTGGTAAGGTDWNKFAGAMQGAKGLGGGDVNQSKAAQAGGGQVGSRSGAGRGPDLGALIHMLLQRSQGYFPAGGSSGQPINPQRQPGLLGI